MLGQASAVLVALLATTSGGPDPRARDRGTFVDTPAALWPERALRPGRRGVTTDARGLAATTRGARGLAATIGEVAIVEGDAAFVSGLDGALGIRFDDERNDLGALVGRTVEVYGDVPGVLVLFTTFEDVGAAGPAYFVPIFDDTRGTGRGPVDQRADFGTTRLDGVINLKRLDTHGERVHTVLAHEVAHRHLAYLPAKTASSTVTRTLTGRQGAHWHAALHTDGSLLGGYAWRSSSMGRYVVVARETGFSDLDLYGLGLVPADAVAPFFFLDGLRTEGGAALPPAAELTVGAVALGTRVALTIDDVVRASGARVPRADEAPRTIPLAFAVVTAPGEAATSTRATALAAELDALRPDFEREWQRLTRGLGRVTTTREEALAAQTDAGAADAGARDAGGDGSASDAGDDDGGVREPSDEGCACTSVARCASAGRGPRDDGAATSGAGRAWGVVAALGLVAIAGSQRRNRRRGA
jgi:hypothetical protein